MWILTPSITSAFAAATGASTSASSEQLAAAFARSLLSRSKPSPQRTWLQRLKRDCWTMHLSGAISSDSLGESFTDWWTSSLAATRASHSQQPASDSAPKTHDTSGRLSQPELLQCDQQSASSRMSKDTFLLGCVTSCKTWQDWVTERRGAWRQRVNAARLTRGSGSLSWPSVTTRDHHSQGSSHGYGQQMLSTMLEKNWPTANARDWKDHGPTQGNRTNPNLGTAVHRNGQAARASSSSLGSRQGLSWMTPRACEAQNPPMGVDKRHHGLTHQVTKQWATPTNCDHKGATTPEACKQWESRGQNLPEQTASISAGKLNPRWVETLMGLPIGWTMPSCIRPVTIAPTSCDSSGMALCRPAQSEPSDFLLASWPSPRAGESQQTDELSRLWVECGYKQPKTRGGKPRANNSTYDVTLETAVRGVAKAETNP